MIFPLLPLYHQKALRYAAQAGAYSLERSYLKDRAGRCAPKNPVLKVAAK